MAVSKKTTKIVEDILNDIIVDTDIIIWDVVYEKEGASWFLKVYIDRESSISFEDCEEISKKLSDKLDELDIIKESYFLEVSSPGIFRKLVRDWHFEKYLNHLVTVKLIRKTDDGNEFIGELLEKNNESVTICKDGKNFTFKNKDIVCINVYEEINF